MREDTTLSLEREGKVEDDGRLIVFEIQSLEKTNPKKMSHHGWTLKIHLLCFVLLSLSLSLSRYFFAGAPFFPGGGAPFFPPFPPIGSCLDALPEIGFLKREIER